jgi:CBS domain-containing protein
MSVQNILDRKGAEVISISPEASVKSATDLMRHARIAALVVRSGDSVAGLFTERELVAAVSEFGQAALSTAVGALANRSVITVAPSDSVKRAMGLMTRYRVRHLPVVADGQLKGLVSIGDLVKSRLEDLETESNVLRDVYLAAQPLHH